MKQPIAAKLCTHQLHQPTIHQPISERNVAQDIDALIVVLAEIAVQVAQRMVQSDQSTQESPRKQAA